MPGLPNGPFPENPVKRPDSIQPCIVEETAKGVHPGFIRIRVEFSSEKKEG
jgi:hypothetical protein